IRRRSPRIRRFPRLITNLRSPTSVKGARKRLGQSALKRQSWARRSRILLHYSAAFGGSDEEPAFLAFNGGVQFQGASMVRALARSVAVRGVVSATMDRGAGEPVVCKAAVASRGRFPAIYVDQRTGDVAGRIVRRGDDRS